MKLASIYEWKQSDLIGQEQKKQSLDDIYNLNTGQILITKLLLAKKVCNLKNKYKKVNFEGNIKVIKWVYTYKIYFYILMRLCWVSQLAK